MILEELVCVLANVDQCEGQIVLTWDQHIPVCLKHFSELWQTSNR